MPPLLLTLRQFFYLSRKSFVIDALSFLASRTATSVTDAANGSAGKGKGKATEDVSMDIDEPEEEEEDDDEEAEDDDDEEVSTRLSFPSPILSSFVRLFSPSSRHYARLRRDFFHATRLFSRR